MSTPAPVLVTCEGSDKPTEVGPSLRTGVCSSCGRIVNVSGPGGKAKWHERWDITAMVERGDFA